MAEEADEKQNEEERRQVDMDRVHGGGGEVGQSHGQLEEDGMSGQSLELGSHQGGGEGDREQGMEEGVEEEEDSYEDEEESDEYDEVEYLGSGNSIETHPPRDEQE